MDLEIEELLNRAIDRIRKNTQSIQESHNGRGTLNGGMCSSDITDTHIATLRAFLDSTIGTLSKRTGRKKSLIRMGKADIQAAADQLNRLHNSYMREQDTQPSVARYATDAPKIIEAAYVKLQHAFAPRIPFNWSVQVFGVVTTIIGAIIGAAATAVISHIGGSIR